MKEEFLSISEFAKRAGVSQQAVYKRLDKDLKPWLIIKENKKALNIKALDIFSGKIDSTEVEKVELLKRTIEVLEKQNETLTKELDIKNGQIDTLNHQVEELNSRLKESHFLIGRQQELQAISEKEEAPAEPAEPIIVEPTPEPAAPDPEEELSDKEIYKRALEKLPPTPKLFDRVLRPELWQKKQQEAIAQMSEKEREVLFKYGFVGDGR